MVFLCFKSLSRLNEELSGTELGGAVIDREVAVLREREAEGERRAEEMRQKGERNINSSIIAAAWIYKFKATWYGREYNELESYAMQF